MNTKHFLFGLTLVWFTFCSASTHAADEVQNGIVRPKQATPILKIGEIRRGMKGYGLSVFHGDKVEPFAVEVISVMRDFAPKRAVIWIRCPGERMQGTGPVQGMSGSPIFLWDKGEKQELGKGGKLIGAFAYGYSWTRDCYAGVQPIEFMRDSGTRAKQKPGDSVADASQAGSPYVMLSNLLTASGVKSEPVARWAPDAGWRAESLRQMFAPPNANEDDTLDSATTVPAPRELGGFGHAMPMPVTVNSASLAKAFGPMLETVGLRAVASPLGVKAGFPPPGVDAKQVNIRPGSVLAVPMAFGDMDLSGTGTVTDVLPDGKVLGFGHAMFGEGKAAVPMASGYVHFVVPVQSAAFKLGGSASIRGAIVRDENSAVVGVGGVNFPTAPLKVRVKMPDLEAKEFNYQVIMHKRLTPMLAGMVAAQSAMADVSLPPNNTTRIRGSIKFAGHKEPIKIDNLLANGSAQGLLMQIAPPVASLMNNSYKAVHLESADLTIDVEPQTRLGTVIEARTDKTKFKPGETVNIDLRIQRYQKSFINKRITFKLPDRLPDGRYPIMITDGRNYVRQMLSARPHLNLALKADDIFTYYKWQATIRNDALYVVMALPKTGVAIGRTEFPSLPSSRASLIVSPSSSITTSYVETAEKVIPMDMVIGSRSAIQIEIENDPTE